MSTQVERLCTPVPEFPPIIISLVLVIIGMTGSGSWVIGAAPIWLLFLALYLLF
jgi:hypothetical protein